MTLFAIIARLGTVGNISCFQDFYHEEINAGTTVDQGTFQDRHADALDQFHGGMNSDEETVNYKITKKVCFEHFGAETSVISKLNRQLKNCFEMTMKAELVFTNS